MPKLFNALTNTQGVIVFGGEASSDYGMVVAGAPSFDNPIRRIEAYTVPGRNGSILFQDGSFDDVVRAYDVWIAKDEEDLADKINAARAWLFSKSGYTRLEDNFEPDVFRLAYYSGGNDISNELTQYGETTLTFTCRPERFLKSGEDAITVVTGDKIFNPTKFASKPLIHIEGSGSVMVSIGNKAATITVSDYVNIDCETMNAYRLPSQPRNEYLTGSFPTIEPGPNSITITGTTTKVTITPRYFTI